MVVLLFFNVFLVVLLFCRFFLVVLLFFWWFLDDISCFLGVCLVVFLWFYHVLPCGFTVVFLIPCGFTMWFCFPTKSSFVKKKKKTRQTHELPRTSQCSSFKRLGPVFFCSSRLVD